MFIGALFTITKIWEPPKCPSVDEWIKQLWDIYTMEFFFLHFFIVVQLLLSSFPPITFCCPTHPHLPHSVLSPYPLSLSMDPLYMFLDDLSPSFLHYPSPFSPLVSVHSGILPGHKKEENFTLCNCMDGSGEHCAK